MGDGWYDMDGHCVGHGVDGAIAWGKRYKTSGARVVASNDLPDGRWVSTILLGLDHRHDDGPPLIFETMVFADHESGRSFHSDRYGTRAEAEAGHAQIVAECLAGEHGARPVARRRIYVASSWRNPHQPGVVAALRESGHEVYDFRHPRPGDNGFSWLEVDPGDAPAPADHDPRRDALGGRLSWDGPRFLRALQHDRAREAFGLDFGAMQWSDTCVLVLPAGRSASIEAGWCKGSGRSLFVLVPEAVEPELMFAMADGFAFDVAGLVELLAPPALAPSEVSRG